jgi:hypothetical protein
MHISYWADAKSMACKLRDAIEEKTGVHLHLSNKFDWAEINYGRSDTKSEHNDPNFVQLCVYKYRFAKLLRENGFGACPEFFRGIPRIFPCLVRERLSSYSAYGIHAYSTKEEYDLAGISDEFWWTPFVRCEHELRVHVLGGEFVKVFKKMPTIEEAELPIRNSYNTYHYSNRTDFKTWRHLMALQETLKPILKGSFYALDVGWDSNEKRYFVFEGNSAPGITDNTAALYADYFIKTLKIGGRSYGIPGPSTLVEGGSVN